MADYNDILKEPYNPIKIDQQAGMVTFPSWLNSSGKDGDNVVSLASLPKQFNQTLEDQIIKLHASFYDAIHWYPMIKGYTPDTIFLKLSENEIIDITTDNVFSAEKYKTLVEGYLEDGYHFVKSSTKSSHQFKKVLTYEDFIDEIMHPDVVMSFKKGCRHIMFRKYIDDIQGEYRIYVYGGMIRYIEQYIGTTPESEAPGIKNDILEYMTPIIPKIQYKDYLVDICFCFGNKGDDQHIVIIEINTPLYLFGGIHLLNYHFNRELLHTTKVPIFAFRNQNNDIQQI